MNSDNGKMQNKFYPANHTYNFFRYIKREILRFIKLILFLRIQFDTQFFLRNIKWFSFLKKALLSYSHNRNRSGNWSGFAAHPGHQVCCFAINYQVRLLLSAFKQITNAMRDRIG